MSTNKADKLQADAIAATAEAQAKTDEAARIAAEIATRETFIADALVEMGLLGELASQGAAAATDGAIMFGVEVGLGHASESDAPRFYLAYANGFNGKTRRGIDALAADEKTAKSQISLWRSFGRATVAAVARDVPSLYDDVARVHGGMSRKETTSCYQAMASVNRAIDAAVRKPSADGKLDLVANLAAFIPTVCGFASDPTDVAACAKARETADEFLRDAMRKDAAKAKDALAKVAALLETLGKLVESDVSLVDLVKPLGSLAEAHAGLVSVAKAQAEADVTAQSTLNPLVSNVVELIKQAA